jgi:motility quorum-sensing regulator/GCU-specific mRNA interferase toxin
MEKNTAHYPLDAVKARVLALGRSAFTKLAVRGIDAMGLTQADAMVVVLGLQRGMLFKSMTTHADRRVWQDVYHAPCPNGKAAYIKVTIQAGAVVIQFKEQ